MNKKLFEEIKKLIKNQNLDIDLKQNEEKIIEEFKDEVTWEYISAYQKLSESFIREFQDKVNWYCINENKKIIKTEKLQDIINQEILIQKLKTMKKEIFEEIKQIIKRKKLDIDLNQNEKKTIEEFQNKIDWNYISIYEKLSESFIREFQNKIDWNYISIFQILSKSFIKEFKDKINWECINENKKIIKTKELQDIINRELLILELL